MGTGTQLNHELGKVPVPFSMMKKLIIDFQYDIEWSDEDRRCKTALDISQHWGRDRGNGSASYSTVCMP
jgi:hypothetical protein